MSQNNTMELQFSELSSLMLLEMQAIMFSLSCLRPAALYVFSMA